MNNLGKFLALYSKVAGIPAPPEPVLPPLPPPPKRVASVPEPVLPPIYTKKKVYDAIRKVESNNGKYLYGDKLNGVARAFGPYQIRRNFWKDARMPVDPNKTWSQQALDEATARRAVDRWHRRYTKGIPIEDDGPVPLSLAETIARKNNGGPTGDKSEATKAYWNKVKAELER